MAQKLNDSFDLFSQKSLVEKAIKSQSDIIEYFSKLKDVDHIIQMDGVDQIIEKAQGSEAEQQQILEYAQVFAKSLEIIQITKISEGMKEIMRQSQNLRYLRKLVKSDEKKQNMKKFI